VTKLVILIEDVVEGEVVVEGRAVQLSQPTLLQAEDVELVEQTGQTS
jgi:hypothetical protein